MAIAANIAVVQRFWEDFNAHQLDGWNEVHTTTFINHDPSLPIPAPDFSTLTQVIGALLTAFPDLTSSEDDLIADGNKVVTRRTVRATHTGAFLGMAPTGKEVAFSSASLAHFSDGTLTEQGIAFDVVGLFRQIGASPSPAARGIPAGV